MHGVTRRQVKTAAATVLAAAMIPAMSACSDDGNASGAPAGGPSGPSAAGPAKHGPMFPVCGGVSDQTVAQLTQVVPFDAATDTEALDALRREVEQRMAEDIETQYLAALRRRTDIRINPARAEALVPR